MKINLFFYLLITILLACNNNANQKLPSKECKVLYDSAFENLQQFNTPSRDTEKLDIALNFYNKAIQCDSNFILPYYSKFSILILKQEFKKALHTLNKLIIFSKESPQLVIRQFYLGKWVN